MPAAVVDGDEPRVALYAEGKDKEDNVEVNSHNQEDVAGVQSGQQ